MEINPINNIAGINLKSLKKSTEPEPQKSVDKSENLIKELDKMSMINNVNIGKKDYELNLSMEELEKRTHKDYLTTKNQFLAMGTMFPCVFGAFVTTYMYIRTWE